MNTEDPQAENKKLVRKKNKRPPITSPVNNESSDDDSDSSSDSDISEEDEMQKQKRKTTYLICGITMIVCIILVGLILMFVLLGGINNSDDGPIAAPLPIGNATQPTIILTPFEPTITPRPTLPTLSPSILGSPTEPPIGRPTPSPFDDVNDTDTNQTTARPTRPRPTPTPPIATPPSDETTETPTIGPTEPTPRPTFSPLIPTNEILENQTSVLSNDGITIVLPPNSFPSGTSFQIDLHETTNDITRLIFDETTVAFEAHSIEHITSNYITFTVDQSPINTTNNTFRTIIPIPDDLIEACPDDYGYEVFAIMQQYGFDEISFPLFALFPSIYNENDETLTTWFYPEVFIRNKADIVLSCTPGPNELQRRRLQSYSLKYCQASEIQCPIENDECILGTPFSRRHYGIDYIAASKVVVAASDGTIEEAGRSFIYGHSIILRHDDGSATVYGALASIDVDPGDVVAAGDPIAISGSSHLHFEYIPNGEVHGIKQRVNPWYCIIDPTLFTLPPTREPTQFVPTDRPTTEPTQRPTESPTDRPSTSPTKHPTDPPADGPSRAPQPNPTRSPTKAPIPRPTDEPTQIPTQSPSDRPTVRPTEEPTDEPTPRPTQRPTHSPTYRPTDEPIGDPTTFPVAEPTVSPVPFTPTAPTTPTQQVNIISGDGNTITDNGITITFPPNAFEDGTELIITISEADDLTLVIYNETTQAFRALPVDNIDNHYIELIVSNMPLNTINITYTITAPIPDDLLIACPSDHGYEMFSIIMQSGYGHDHDSFPLFALFESKYDQRGQTLTAEITPFVFEDFIAGIIISCSPGINPPILVSTNVRRRRLKSLNLLRHSKVLDEERRTLLHDNDHRECQASDIKCPIYNDGCYEGKAFSLEHLSTDFKANFSLVVAAADGTIEVAGPSIVYHELIILRHLDGSATVYADLSEDGFVDIGDSVKAGDILGRAGESHLHFEYIPNGKVWATKQRIDASRCIPHFSEFGITTTLPPVVNGSVTISDSGALADDAFALFIDGFYICETREGSINTCAVSNLRHGPHTLSILVTIAPDDFGTYRIVLHDGLVFDDGSHIKDNVKERDPVQPPKGAIIDFNFTVPLTTTQAPSR